MMRIIAGQFKGRTLEVPPSVTRPTSSRVREAIFSSIQHTLAGFDDLAVLDLFAGSGALGIEALSRGADHVVFIENDRTACEVISNNLVKCGTRAIVTCSDALIVVGQNNPHGPFDVVFADPPYSLDDEAVTMLLHHLMEGKWMAADGLLVVERGTKSEFAWPVEFEEITKRTYGDTAIWYGQL
ncbi:MAG: 16S rRNA (guanine(966)-N(2))-methyltransferase RsmD [Actinomycetes bacterium]